MPRECEKHSKSRGAVDARGTAAAAGWNALILIGGTNTMTGATAPFPGARAGTNVWLWISVVFLADSLAQFYGLVDRRLGSYLEPGTIAALNYASLVASVPSAIIGVALSTAIFPFPPTIRTSPGLLKKVRDKWGKI